MRRFFSRRATTATAGEIRRDAFTTLLRNVPAVRARVAETWRVGDRVLDLYEVTDVHREGGMGIVYRVRHLAWDTDLAVKSPRAALFRDDADRARFTREAETWISLGLHPNVCSCHYVRTLGGVPRVFAEYVEGGSLRDWIRDGRLHAGGPREALARILDIAVQVAWGLEHAHRHGVVHQDVKPANVLLDARGTAKVTDFGLADATVAGMTPAYASPEQAARRPVGVATDIWSFAVSVLEMFAGEVTWLAGPAAGEALAGLRDRTPPPVADLLAHCLCDDPADRPEGMAPVAARLRSLYEQATGEPHPREEPQAVALRADELNNRGLSLLDLGRRDEAEAAFEQAREIDPQHPETLYNAGLIRWRTGRLTDDRFVRELQGMHASTGGSQRARTLLAHVHLERGDVDALDLSEVDDDGLRDAARSDEVLLARQAHVFEQGQWAVADLSADSRHVVTGDGDGVIRLFDADGTCVLQFRGHGTVSDLSLSADTRYLLSAGMDPGNPDWRYTLKLWDLKRGECVRALVSDVQIDSACLSADGRHAVFGCGDEMVRLWKLKPDLVHMVGGPSQPPVRANTIAHHPISLSPDEKLVLSGGFVGSTASLWDVRTGRRVREFHGHARNIHAVHLGSTLAVTGGQEGEVRLWDTGTGECLRVFEGHADRADAVWLSADNRFVVSGGIDHTVRLWDVESGRCLRTFDGHTKYVRSVRLSADNRRIVSGAGDGTVRVWDLTRSASYVSPLSVCRPVAQDELVRLDRSVTALVASVEEALDTGRTADAFDALSTARAQPGYERSPRVLAAWRRLARSAVPTGLAGIWQAGTFTGHTDVVRSAFATPDGTLAASQDWSGAACVWEVESRRVVHTFRSDVKITRMAMSPDGGRLLLGHVDGRFDLRDLASGELLKSFHGHEEPGGLHLTDGRFALSSSLMQHKVWVWDVETGQPRHVVDIDNGVGGLAVTPDEAFGLVCNGRGAVQVWDLARGVPVRTLTGHSGSINSVCVSSDGRRVLSAGSDHTVRLWDLASGRCLRVLTGHEDHVDSVAISADGLLGFSCAWDAQVRVWDLESGECLRVLGAHTDRLSSVSLSSDGRFALSAGFDHVVHVWELDRDLALHPEADWDDGALPYVEAFLAVHGAEGDVEVLLRQLRHAGYGWLRPAAVRSVVTRMT